MSCFCSSWNAMWSVWIVVLNSQLFSQTENWNSSYSVKSSGTQDSVQSLRSTTPSHIDCIRRYYLLSISVAYLHTAFWQSVLQRWAVVALGESLWKCFPGLQLPFLYCNYFFMGSPLIFWTGARKSRSREREREREGGHPTTTSLDFSYLVGPYPIH